MSYLPCLEYVKLPDNIAGFPDSSVFALFSSTEAELKIEIPASATTLGRAFENSWNLTEIVLNEGLKTIGYNCFYKCKKLKSIEIPSTVTSITGCAFEYCTSLKSIKIPENANLTDSYILAYNTGLESAEIYSTSIPNCTLYGCTALKSVVIGEKVSRIEGWNFYDTNNLTSVEFKNPKGWSVSGVGAISEADLKDPASAAAKVKQYYYQTWTRSDS